MPDKEVSIFRRICAIEPGIAQLLFTARSPLLRGEPEDLWDHFFLPQIDRMVGPHSENPWLRTERMRQIVADQIAKALHSRT